ncbi:MAG: ABC transporter substrate-binding protein [Chloroflexi bacterium]|jgi:peptide/nickel transport system substrate-binding protein|nr:ABC transporter substrate-binding protein [Chloroflexota bacterium]MBT7080002.1 ABC transporter substrate-binding protein [Chloroflexota bacterium]MBT7289223.1 ABC transporter substrate-binding protein [Chloroflexota bacterium]
MKKPLFKVLAFVGLAATMILSSVLGACSSSVVPGNVRIVGGVQTSSGISTLNPFWAQRFPNTQYVGLIMEPLVYGQEDGSSTPLLATDWSVDSTGKIWTVNLDPDAMWSDGEALTADDVVFTFKQQYANAGEWSQGRSNGAMMLDINDDGEPDAGAIVAVDDHTVKFTLNATYAEQVFLSGLNTVFICPEHIWAPKIIALEAADSSIEQYALEESATLADELIGSGPFLFNEYVALQYVLYDTDPDYWGGTPAIVDQVMLKMYATADGATLALKSGEVDMLALVEAVAEVPKLLLDQNITIDILPNFNSTVMFFLNMRFPPLHILEVRQAIDMALNKQDLITFAQFGYGTLPSMVPFAPGLAESNDDLEWTDTYVDSSGDFLSLAARIDNANDLLDDVPGMSAFVAGETRTWTSPDHAVPAIPLSWEGLYLSSPSYQRAAELVSSQMAEIGIDIVPTVETGAFGPKVFSGWQVFNYETIIFGYPSDPNFDGMVKQWGQPVFGGNYDGSVVAWNNDPSMSPPKEDGYRPQVYDTPYDEPTAAQEALWLDIYDQLVADAADINADLRATRFITNSTARQAAVMQVQEDFADALPIVNLYHPQSMSAFRTDSFEGWGNPSGIFLYGFMPGTTSVTTLMRVSPIEE